MKMRRFGLFIFSLFFLAETILNRGVELTPFQWVMLGFAASMAGRASAYLSVLEWLRAPFAVTVPHSSGAGEDNHPKWNTGLRSALAELICCPVCAGTWGATLILTTYKLDAAWGNTILYTLGAASVAWLVSFTTQYVEWRTHEARENVGLINRRNQFEIQERQLKLLKAQDLIDKLN